MSPESHGKTAYIASGVAAEGEAAATPENQPLSERKHQPCGTPAAAKWHQRRGQEPCGPCRDALRTYNREYAKLARQNAAWRARTAQIKQRWDREHRAQLNAVRRERERIRREQARAASHIDEVVVERLVAGECVFPHNRAERLEAVRVLRSSGYSYQAIASRLRICPRQVHRDLADLGLTTTRGEVA